MHDTGIQHVSFVGDSYMRQIFAGAVITFSADYEAGALLPHADGCRRERQFEDRDCRHLLKKSAEVCDNTVQMTYTDTTSLSSWIATTPDDLANCTQSGLLLMSFGNHPTLPDYVTRTGVNSVVHIRQELLSLVCDISIASTSCNIWWISTHQRLNNLGSQLDEEHDIVRSFNVGMRLFFESNRCGPMHFVDVFNMTDGLLAHPDAADLTYDGAHWGMTVNLLKVQILLSDLLQKFRSF